MRTRAEHGRRGQDTQIFRSDWHPDEVGVCLALAAVWDRLEQGARRALLRPVFVALGEEVPADVGEVEVWREMPWVTPGGAPNQRQDLVLILRGWGTILIEAKVSQAYWAQSGPAKLPEYARELRRRLDAGDVHGPNGAVVALTPAPVPARELNGGEGIPAGGLTWSAISLAAGGIADGGAHPVAQALLPELLHILVRRGLDAPLKEIDAAMLTAIATSLEALDRIVPALDRYLATLAREATAFGLTEAEIIRPAEQPFGSGSFRRPYVSWEVDTPGRRNTFVAVVVDIGAGRVRFLVSVQFDNTPPANHLSALVGSDPLGEDVEVHVWSPDRLIVAPPRLTASRNSMRCHLSSEPRAGNGVGSASRFRSRESAGLRSAPECCIPTSSCCGRALRRSRVVFSVPTFRPAWHAHRSPPCLRRSPLGP